MNDPAQDRDDIAAGWVVRMEDANWSEADEVALQCWLESDPRHRGALLQAQALWASFGEVEPQGMALPVFAAERAWLARGSEWERATSLGVAGNGVGVGPDAGDLDETGANDETVDRMRVTRRWLLGGAGAAIAASVAGAFIFLRGAQYATAVGEIRRVPLADGSVASINTDSVVTIELADASRRVDLAKGEAWFQVAKDSKRPFIVAAGRVRAQAIGTAFSVRRREDGADILVTEGVVEAWADGAEGNKVRLVAGQSAFVADNAAIRPEAVAPGSVDRALAWRSGKIDLVAMPLSTAAAEFNRYNTRQIVIADPSIGREQFDGVFGISDPETFAVAVRDGLSVPIDLSDPTRVRIGKSRP